MISFITLTILTFKKKKKKCLPFSGSKPGRWGAFEDWLVMRCMCKKDINVLLSLKHTISAGSCYIKCFFFFFPPVPDGGTPVYLWLSANWTPESQIIIGLFSFDLDTSRGRNTSLQPAVKTPRPRTQTLSHDPVIRLVISTSSVVFRIRLSSIRFPQMVQVRKQNAHVLQAILLPCDVAAASSLPK